MFKDKQFFIGLIIGIFLSSILTGIITYKYLDKNYVELNKVDIGYFIFKDGHIYQLEQLVDESQLTQEFKKSK